VRVLRDVLVGAPLDVHVLPFREPFRHRHDGGQLAAEVAGDPARELGGLGVVTQRAGRDLEQLTKAVSQTPEVAGIRGWRRAGGAHRSTMPEDERGAKGIITTGNGKADRPLRLSPK